MKNIRLSHKERTVKTIFAIALLTASTGSAWASGTSCEDLTKLKLPNTDITAATMVAKARRMTVLLLVALGFLAVLAYGAVALGFTHAVFERLARKQDQRVSGGRR